MKQQALDHCAKKCRTTRESLTFIDPGDEHLASLNVVITIVAEFFVQKDLGDTVHSKSNLLSNTQVLNQSYMTSEIKNSSMMDIDSKDYDTNEDYQDYEPDYQYDEKYFENDDNFLKLNDYQHSSQYQNQKNSKINYLKNENRWTYQVVDIKNEKQKGTGSKDDNDDNDKEEGEFIETNIMSQQQEKTTGIKEYVNSGIVDDEEEGELSEGQMTMP